MKKLLLLFVILLNGCGDNKVTPEMLVGEWKCDIKLEGVTDLDWLFDSIKDAESTKSSIAYKIENKKLFEKPDGQKDWIFIDEKNLKNSEDINTDESGDTTKIIRNVIYISNDNFKMEYIYESSIKDYYEIDDIAELATDYKLIHRGEQISKGKIETNCFRVN
ncbi:hypothetical protein [Orbus mooreae]|uniref:hypothetical protein n=1 Tax=Orbus mooreae TaxID=3074107 RepID=UPI00370DC6C8